MKHIFIKAAAVLTCAFLLGHSMPVYAADVPLIELKSGEINEEDSQATISCAIARASGVTSGKIRIKYEGEKMKLESANAGEGLSGAMCEINDCLSGNKKEGEIVVAFAAASPLKDNGSLVDMTFRLGSEVKAQTVLEVTASVEELAADGQDVTPEVKQLSVEVGKADQGQATPTPGTNDGDKSDGGDKDNGGSGKNAGGTQKDRHGNTSKTGGTKTGDETNVAVPAVAAGIALIAVTGLLVWRKRRCR